MITYTYKREDGSTFQVKQRITDKKLERCPDTGQKVVRVINNEMPTHFSPGRHGWPGQTI